MKKYWCETESDLMMAIHKSVDVCSVIPADGVFPVGLVTTGKDTWLVHSRELFDAIEAEGPEEEPIKTKEMTPEELAKIFSEKLVGSKFNVQNIDEDGFDIKYEDDAVGFYLVDPTEDYTPTFCCGYEDSFNDHICVAKNPDLLFKEIFQCIYEYENSKFLRASEIGASALGVLDE